MEGVSGGHRLERRHDLDWLRILAVLLLVPFHSALIFSLDPNDIVYVKDVIESSLLVELAGFVHLWHMPLLFVISGMGTWYALRFRTAGQYLQERFLRLAVPLVFGFSVLVPPMVYLYRVSVGDGEVFWQFYPRFFAVNWDDLSGRSGSFTVGHLWFILFLFVYSLVALPLFLALRRASGRRLIDRLATLSERPGVIILLFVPLAIVAPLLDLGGMPVLFYLLLFIAGYILAADARFERVIERYTTAGLVIGIVTAVVIVTVSVTRVLLDTAVGTAVVHSVYYLGRWSWVIALLGLGRRHLSRDSRLLRYLSEASYPLYILHLLINTAVGYVVVQWQASIAVKYLAINAVTFALMFVVYEALIRRLGVLRVLFGLKLRRREPAAAPQRGEG